MDALKEQLYQKASDLGAAMVKTAPVERWESIPIQDPAFWPQNIWPWCKSVIVLAIPMFLPMAGSTPSMVYQELYNTSNRVMDDMAYQLANCILRLGWRANFFSARLLRRHQGPAQKSGGGFFPCGGRVLRGHRNLRRQP